MNAQSNMAKGEDPIERNGVGKADVLDFQISILDLLIVFARYKWIVIGLPLIAGIVAAVVALRMTEIYSAQAKLLPPQQNQSAASAILSQIGQLGAAAGGAGAVAFGAGRNPSDVYVSMLRSRRIADALIDRFKMLDESKGARRSDVQAALMNASQIRLERDGLISVTVDDTDPKRAAAIANAYPEELDKLSGTLALTEASSRRIFMERQLNQAKDSLLKAEMAARSAIEERGLAQVDAQGRTLVQTSASLRGRMAAKEVEIYAMRNFAAEQNPNLNKAQQELAALREQISKIEQGESNPMPRSVSDKGMKNVSLLRELRYQEALFEGLFRQVEAAKLDEARENSVVQVLDPATPPDRRSRPQRSLIVLMSMLAATIAAVVLIFLLEALRRARTSPDGNRRMELFRNELIGRPTHDI